jgi:hypothetical protein
MTLNKKKEQRKFFHFTKYYYKTGKVEEVEQNINKVRIFFVII